MLLTHHLLQLNAVIASLAELLRNAFDAGEGVVDVVSDVGELLGEAVVALGDHVLGLFAGDMGDGIGGVASSNTVIALNGILCLFWFLIGDGVVGEGVRSFEVDVREEALVVGESSSTEGDLLDAV